MATRLLRAVLKTGALMRKFGFILAMAAAIAMSILPAAPAMAKATDSKSASWQSTVAVLSQDQLDAIKQRAPNLYNRIVAAQQSQKSLVVTESEARLFQAINQKSLSDVKAGGVELTVAVAAAVVIITVLWKPITGKDAPAFLQVIADAILCVLGDKPSCEAMRGPKAPQKQQDASAAKTTIYAARNQTRFQRMANASSQYLNMR